MEKEYFEFWFAAIHPLSCKKKLKLKELFGNGKEIYHIEESSLHKLLFLTDKEIEAIIMSKKEKEIQKTYEAVRTGEVKFYHYGSEGYPKRLMEIDSPPYALYVKGRLPREDRLSISVIGARQCSPYGRRLARQIGLELAGYGAQVVSGMARGIDGIAQTEALRAGGYSCGVLAGGVDVCYPREHVELYMELLEKGGLVSEQPLKTKPLASYFPARNRIISGLSDAVIVVEAKEKSGTFITVDRALEQGKEVYALPGDVTNALSNGCHMLIKQGAGLFTTTKEMLEELGFRYDKNVKKQTEHKIVLEKEENLVYSCLGLRAKHVEEIMKETNLSAAITMNQLISLTLKGMAHEISKNYYVK